jgi:aryl-alcohol dehydrogenase-like predicted oxidoreductase
MGVTMDRKSKLIFGTASTKPSLGVSSKMLQDLLCCFIESGGCRIDTAESYGDFQGQTEEIIGDWITSGKHHDVEVSTKCFVADGAEVEQTSLKGGYQNATFRAKDVINACHASLKRLRVDKLDTFFLHRCYFSAEPEELLKAFETLITAGKINKGGVSDFPAWKIHQLMNLDSEKYIQVAQYKFNLATRDIEHEILPTCEMNNIEVQCWSPLAGGLLTNKYQIGKKPEKNTRFSKLKKVPTDEQINLWLRETAQIREYLWKLSIGPERTPASLSLDWLIKHPKISAIVFGVSTKDQLYEIMRQSDHELSGDEWKHLDNLSRKKAPYPYNQYRF